FCVSVLFAALLLGGLTGCPGRAPAPVEPAATESARPAPEKAQGGSIRFMDVAGQAGIDFRLGHGGRSPLTILETAGGGAAFLDFDGDGKPDALLVGPHRVGLYHNLGGGRFEDVSANSGFNQDGYWMGCAAGDYDGDGRVDVLLTGYGRTALYRNLARGRFEDVTRAVGINVPGWSLSGAFADFDGDGRLDLYVTRYVKFDRSTTQVC